MIDPKLIILAIYFSILLGIGFFASKRITNISDYYVGGKKLSYWIAALSARSTGESGWLLIGVTGMGALIGVSAFWIVVGEVLGVFISWQFMAKKFKRLTDEYNSITIPDFLVSHFRSSTNTIRIIAAAALSIIVVIYVSAQIDVTGKTFESFLGFNYYTGIILGFGIVVLYIFSGGFLAVAWSDFFQGALMFVGLLILPIVAYFSLSSDASLISDLYALDPALLNIWGPGGFSLLNFMTVVGLVSIGIGFMGSPQVYVRFMAIKNENEIEKAEIISSSKDDDENVLLNSPHTMEMITSNEWKKSYTREYAAYPLDYVRENKFWPSVTRIDEAFGDRNLICTCSPIENYIES